MPVSLRRHGKARAAAIVDGRCIGGKSQPGVHVSDGGDALYFNTSTGNG